MTAEQDAMKEQILEKALEVFAEQDYISIEAIAARARIPKEGIYQFFRDKEALFIELLERAAHHRRQVMEDGIGMIDDIRGKFGRLIISLLRFAKSHPHYFRLLTMDVSFESPEYQARFARIESEYQGIITGLLSDGVRQNKLREVNPAIAATLLCKMIEGALIIVDEDPNCSADQIVLTMLDIIWNGYGK